MPSLRPFPLAALAGSVLIPAAALLGPGVHPAAAHGIQSSLERLGSLVPNGEPARYSLQSSFSSGAPAAEASVRLVPPGGGDGLALGRTDAAGRLSFRLPGAVPAGWELQVDAGPGHRDYLELPEASGAAPQARHGHPAGIGRWLVVLPAAAGAALLGLVASGGWRRAG